MEEELHMALCIIKVFALLVIASALWSMSSSGYGMATDGSYTTADGTVVSTAGAYLVNGGDSSTPTFDSAAGGYMGKQFFGCNPKSPADSIDAGIYYGADGNAGACTETSQAYFTGYAPDWQNVMALSSAQLAAVQGEIASAKSSSSYTSPAAGASAAPVVMAPAPMAVAPVAAAPAAAATGNFMGGRGYLRQKRGFAKLDPY